MTTPDDVLKFWLDDLTPKDWYSGEAHLDQAIRDQFEAAWQSACEGTFGLWLTHPTGTLAYIILMDQFPRNMFRGQGKAFASDKHARAAAKVAIHRGWDMKIDAPARQFFYMPLMHSENLCDQDRAVRLFLTRMPDKGGQHLLHAQAHREIIRRFGRFPYRNEALCRETTAPEVAFITEGGYGAQVKALQVPA
ncbi:DUF924 family protein [Algirhabdus cladophorae]|uniref:DUF924 family protein n=1 Tax=Algirhabdus cladophorae TaxID=3377108 RepID=UPI003B847D1B